MARRTTGTLLIVVSTALYATRYLSAAIFGSSLTNWSADLFNAMLEYVGTGLVTWSVIALVAGFAYLAWAEAETFLQSKAKKITGPSKSHIDEMN